MSIINQMLRDLDARGAVPADQPATSVTGREQQRRPSGRSLVWAGLALAGAAALYWGWPDARKGAPSADIFPAQESAESTAVASVPAARMPKPRPQAAAPVLPKVSAQPAAPTRANEPDERPVPPSALAQGHASAAAVAPPGAAVVKTLAELSPEAEAQQLYDEAQGLRRSGRQDAAIGKYRQALERNPGMVPARIQLARLMQESGRSDAALALLKVGHEHHPDDALAIAAGRLLADLGRGEEALEWLVRGQAGLRPADHALMGALLSQAGRHEEASRAYQRALAADPGQGGWHLGLGLALEAQGRTEEAQAAYRDALARGQFKPEVVQFLRERTGHAGP